MPAGMLYVAKIVVDAGRHTEGMKHRPADVRPSRGRCCRTDAGYAMTAAVGRGSPEGWLLEAELHEATLAGAVMATADSLLATPRLGPCRRSF